MKPKLDEKPLSWTSPGGCSSCAHCGMDADLDPYCAHTKAVEINRFGLNINDALARFCHHNLWEKKNELPRPTRA
jgi:hypothetical protein